MLEPIERPVLFSGPMVQAIRTGQKTQTRRVMVSQPPHYRPGPLRHPAKHPAPYFDSYCGEPKTPSNPRGMSDRWCWWSADDRPAPDTEVRCRYGVPGDRLWVRETWQYADWTEDGLPWIRYAADGAKLLRENVTAEWAERLGDEWAALSSAENVAIDGVAADRRRRPSIYMPRWASRILLEVTQVRAERVQSISEMDALDEGVEGRCVDGVLNGVPGAYVIGSARAEYEALWNKINAPRGYGWNKNPWVFVIEYKVIEGLAPAASHSV